MIYDTFGRPLNSLRIQVNASCNFKCFFCHMEGTDENGSMLTPEMIERVVKIAASNGVNRVKFTGGEPLLRKDMEEIISRTRKHVSGDISLTTNAFFLKERANSLKNAGLNRINISMHSIEEEKFETITGVRALDRVREGISAAKAAGLEPVKVNFVVLRELNEDQIGRMMRFCAEQDAILQLIEYETDRQGERSEIYQKYHYDLRPLEDHLSRMAEGIETNSLHNRKRFQIRIEDGRVAKVEIVRPQRNADFCNHCTRLRVTSKGEFQTCLNRRDQLFPFSDLDDIGIGKAFENAVLARVPYWREADENSY
ncbi:MAG: GTP 3',8-cyclase MoaA [Thermoplasmata archaeon]